MQGENEPIKLPKGATHQDDHTAVFYKVGLRGWVYYYSTSKEWKRSSKTRLPEAWRIQFYDYEV